MLGVACRYRQDGSQETQMNRVGQETQLWSIGRQQAHGENLRRAAICAGQV